MDAMGQRRLGALVSVVEVAHCRRLACIGIRAVRLIQAVTAIEPVALVVLDAPEVWRRSFSSRRARQCVTHSWIDDALGRRRPHWNRNDVLRR